MRVVILWKQLSSQTRACFCALASEGVDLFVVHRSATPDAPYEDGELEAGMPGDRWEKAPDYGRLVSQTESFAPDAVLVSSWDVGAYRRACRAMSGRTLRVLCMDNQWLGTAKQWAGRLVSPVVIRPAYDVAFLPDEGQAAFARRLGFGDDRILWGLYSGDHDSFAAVPPELSSGPVSRDSFLFVGRLAHEKGVKTLAEAYRLYRRTVDDPWPLLVAGTGPLAPLLDGIPGVELLGFVQPARLPQVFGRASCLVLPSRFEPWGVVIHEATAAGLAVVCSSACGAATRLVLDGYNGAVVPPDDPQALSLAMSRVAGMDDAARAEMGQASRALARQLTPQRWARYLIDRIPELRAAIGLSPADP